MRQLGHSPVVAGAAAIALGGAAGHAALAFGGPFTWLLFWVVGAMLCPLLVCIVTRRRRLPLNAALANLSMLGAPALEELALGWLWPGGKNSPPPAVSVSDFLTFAALSAFSLPLPLAVVGAFESRREE
jgi:hypothetical protein